MSILDVTEEQIFHTLGKGRDPNFKQIEKIRPTIPPTPKKTYVASVKTHASTPAKAPVESIKSVPSHEIEESIHKLTTELSDLNKGISGIQSMIKLYLILFAVTLIIFVGLLGLFIKYY
jgi:hypothetical protein